jgi:hypothetical protein
MRKIGLRVGDRIENVSRGSSWNADDETDRMDPGDIGRVIEVVQPEDGPVIVDDDGEEIDTSRDGFARVQWPHYKRISLVCTWTRTLAVSR